MASRHRTSGGQGGLRFRTESYFDREAVIAKLGPANAAAMSKAGAFLRQTAQRSMRRRKGASKPGRPPYAHVGTLKRRIQFAFDEATASLVVGPTPIGSVGIVPPTLEFGGDVPRRPNPRRSKRELGGAGEIRIGGRASRTTKMNRDGKIVTYAKLATAPQVARSNRLNEELYGPEYIGGGEVKPRPYMGPALKKEMPALPALWAGSVKS